MKDGNQSLERLLVWAREARGLELSRKLKLSGRARKKALTAWRAIDRNAEWLDSVSRLLRWSVAYSIIIMLVSVYYNHGLLDVVVAADVEDSPQTVFHSGVSAKFYVP